MEKFEPHNIVIIENLLDKLDCIKLIDFIDSLEGQSLSINNGNNVECFIWNLDELLNDINYKSTVEDWITFLFQKFDYAMSSIQKEYNFLKYDTDSGFHLRKIFGRTNCHVDSISTPQKGYGRCLSVIVALNDDFDGGEFFFKNHNVSKKLKQGSLIAFPPYWTHPHEVSSVGKGQFRYTVSTWMLEKID